MNVGSFRDREVACSASDLQSLNFESCVWRAVSSYSSHHPQEVLLAQSSLFVHKSGLKLEFFHFLEWVLGRFLYIEAISRQKEARSLDYALLLFWMTSRVLHSAHISTVHSIPSNSLERCIWTTTMTNIRLDRDSNLVPSGYKPQSIWMRHRGRPPPSRHRIQNTCPCGLRPSRLRYLSVTHAPLNMISLLVSG